MTETKNVYEWLSECADDPLRFVMEGFPWRNPYMELEGEDGPEDWQIDVLREVRDSVRSGEHFLGEAVASGHGTGTSTLVAWLGLWALATGVDSRGVITAETELQLWSKTWPEVCKWHHLFRGREMFEVGKTHLSAADPARALNWRLDAVVWSRSAPEVFAGIVTSGRVFAGWDNPSSIPDTAWDAMGAAFEDSDFGLWLAAGIHSRNEGRFAEKFDPASGWKVHRVDSRKCRRVNQKLLRQWAESFGEDSDFFRMRVTGEGPSLPG